MAPGRTLAVIVALAALLAVPRVARAGELRVVVLLDPCRRVEVARALRDELAWQVGYVLAREAPGGATPVARAAEAQRVGAGVSAAVALWVEHGVAGDELHAVSSDGSVWRHAPLPDVVAVLDVHVIATIAGSLIAEVLAAAPPAVDEEDASEAPAPAAPAAAAAPVAAVSTRAAPLRAPRTFVAVGGGVLQVGTALDLRVVRRLDPHLRLGGGFSWLRFGDAQPWSAAAFTGEVTLLAAGDRRVGVELGVFGGLTWLTAHDEGELSYQPGLGLGPFGMRAALRVPLEGSSALRLEVDLASLRYHMGSRAWLGAFVLYDVGL